MARRVTLLTIVVLALAANTATTTAASDDDSTESTTAPTGHGESGFTVEIDADALPAPQPGRDGVHIGPSVSEPDYSDGIGAFRINCSFSHMNFDDPIVYPGEPGASHLHVFYGNTAVDARSNADSIANDGTTTCTGGIANRSAYWVPAVVDTANGAPVVPEGENAVQVYYKTGYLGVEAADVVAMPAGLRIVAGEPTATTPGELSTVWYTCVGDHPVAQQPSFPACAPGDLFVMTVEFPQCWDGENLDSPDHRSHMARASDGCPESHPVPLPVITQNFRYTVPAGGMATWRLASDHYDGPAGYSGHADWWNGWDHDVFQRVVDNCFTAGLDCHMNNLGDGDRLI